MERDDKELDNEIAKYIQEQKSLPQSEINSKEIVRFLQEYLKTYIVVGFDLHGDRVIISDTPTVQDFDSIKRLTSLLYKNGEFSIPGEIMMDDEMEE